MKNFLNSYIQSFRLIFKDPVNIMLALIPVTVGLGLYIWGGSYFIGEATTFVRGWVEGHVSGDTWGSIVYYILISFVTVLAFLVVNWTFVLFVSILACPFNDLLSERIEKQYLGHEAELLSKSIGKLTFRLWKTLFNEIKKIIVIILAVLLSFSLSFIPLLVPVSYILTALILAAGFIDYSWSRHNLSFRDCLLDLKKGAMSYGISGIVYVTLIAIPVINLFILPFAVVHYTILFIENKKLDLGEA